MAVKETVTFPAAQMILAVKKPDYLGDGKWDLRHGRRAISARIEDGAWLRRFQSREVDVRPGNSLRCEVRIGNLYGYDNELLTERYWPPHVYLRFLRTATIQFNWTMRSNLEIKHLPIVTVPISAKLD